LDRGEVGLGRRHGGLVEGDRGRGGGRRRVREAVLRRGDGLVGRGDLGRRGRRGRLGLDAGRVERELRARDRLLVVEQGGGGRLDLEVVRVLGGHEGRFRGRDLVLGGLLGRGVLLLGRGDAGLGGRDRVLGGLLGRGVLLLGRGDAGLGRGDLVLGGLLGLGGLRLGARVGLVRG